MRPRITIWLSFSNSVGRKNIPNTPINSYNTTIHVKRVVRWQIELDRPEDTATFRIGVRRNRRETFLKNRMPLHPAGCVCLCMCLCTYLHITTLASTSIKHSNTLHIRAAIQMVQGRHCTLPLRLLTHTKGCCVVGTGWTELVDSITSDPASTHNRHGLNWVCWRTVLSS